MALSDYLLKKPVIDTNRLSIRPMCAADVSALREWMPDKSRPGKNRQESGTTF